jgi:hypothetical protein
MISFEYWQSLKNGRWYWHLLADNGEVIAGGQGYASKQGCVQGILRVKKYAPVASEVLVYDPNAS